MTEFELQASNVRIVAVVMLCGLMTIITSCHTTPKEVKEILNKSGHNRIELEKVISYYQKTGEREKLQAAYFLISNMKYNFSYQGSIVDNFDEIFNVIDSLRKKKVKINYTNDLQIKWDSLVMIFGRPTLGKAEIIPDYSLISSDFLIENIEWAFKIRDSTAWGHDLSFDDFCSYVLPYRVGTERIESWRPHLYIKTKIVRDTTTALDRFEYTDVSNDALDRYLSSNKVFWSYPFDIPISKYEKSYLGACQHNVNYTTLIMRANGLPVCTDYVQRWANKKNGHEWNVLLKEDGKWHPFDAAQGSFTMEYDQDRWIAKVFRKTFSKGNIPIPTSFEEEIPIQFYQANVSDVTKDYKKVVDVNVLLKYPSPSPMEYAVICTFDNVDWSPIYFGRISGSHAMFPDMGVGVMYTVKYYSQDDSKIASDPFLLDTAGRITSFDPDEKHKIDMTITRKYPLTGFMKGIMNWTVKCFFQGSDNMFFNNPTLLHKIETLPENFTEVKINAETKFRYVRFCSPKDYEQRGAHVAEIEFFVLGDNGKDTLKINGNFFGADSDLNEERRKSYSKLFDGDLLTYHEFSNNKLDWIGVDLGKPYKIVKIKYSSRNDLNFIEPGHTYELAYWKNNKWVSLGRQVATQQHIKFKEVPIHSIYILHDLTKGVEERIFTYQQGKQIFW